MRRYLWILIVTIGLLVLAGCTEAPEETIHTEATFASQPEIRTEQELLTLFSEYAEADWVVVDCVLFEQSRYGILGVIQYTTGDEGCMFDFVRSELPVLRIGVQAEPVSPGGELRCEGDDRISCQLRGEEGLYTCSIACTAENGEVNFVVTTD